MLPVQAVWSNVNGFMALPAYALLPASSLPETGMQAAELEVASLEGCLSVCLCYLYQSGSLESHAKAIPAPVSSSPILC